MSSLGKPPSETCCSTDWCSTNTGKRCRSPRVTASTRLVVMDEFGADALRFATTHMSTGGQDIRWDARRVEMGRNFNNKLWNATRFAFMNLDSINRDGEIDEGSPETLPDRWILSRLQRATREVTLHLEAYDLGAANRTIYDFVWSEFCDWYLEAAKPGLRGGDPRTRFVLKTVLTDILKLLAPVHTLHYFGAVRGAGS